MEMTVNGVLNEKQQNIMQWAKEMIKLSVKERAVRRYEVFPRRGEVWTCKFGENVGSEINNTHPCLIIQNDVGNENSPTTIVLPITLRPDTQPTQVKLYHGDFSYVESQLKGTSLAEQIKTVSKARLGRKIAELSTDAMEVVEDSLKVALGLS
ncbi:type II toxin-antitoxin system PemK/MazF family toxin (plasmid) [Aneurinibacillus sp. Ricciae_BoGa-3]|uniref:type II toxin-antitoxin system PemK/MazF family toxin n=1 Tax=Aneurinibacillus sp. Ricciae_BoGa-3 TaxID=3022697 RepID=UPI002340DC33|nr:type II toxin-antitoxin system PemK/MazF family toxin [Aneurinibacillus sp. Ricciae_BoGa-3]WCK57025.1 type II toxin-antitoxin system PemK/MazF family toxin [Aneurinibacillus sp. Ricciae_BoGa-3]